MARNNRIKSVNIDQFYKDCLIVMKVIIKFLWNGLIPEVTGCTTLQTDIMSDQKRVTTVKSLPFKSPQSGHTMRNKDFKI